jgi:hypothetical protein
MVNSNDRMTTMEKNQIGLMIKDLCQSTENQVELDIDISFY